MLRLSMALIVIIEKTLHSDSLTVSFISWNVYDNLKFKKYNTDIVSTLLKLSSTTELPDLYAITFQENCWNCKKSNLHKIAKLFIDTIQNEKSESYKLISIHDTRGSSRCESFFCLRKTSMHGTTLIMILVKSNLKISDSFTEKNNRCSAGTIKNNEKGIVVIGIELNNKKLCFGGLHLDVKRESYRKKCFVEILEKIQTRCDILFFGGDFNTRVQPKSNETPKEFNDGRNENFLEKMRETDEFSGPNPYNGQINFLDYIRQKKEMSFIEPFNKAPEFLPTYSISSKPSCKYTPVCYRPSRFPAWTDRIIFYPESMVKCTEYSDIRALAKLSDHTPIYAICEVEANTK